MTDPSPLQDTGESTWGGGTTWRMNLNDDRFVHFTPVDRAEEVVASGKLLNRPPYKKFGGDAVYAVSTVWGSWVPRTQTTHYGRVELVGIFFTTTTKPKIGYSEEVLWDRDVTLKTAKIIPFSKAVNMLRKTPHPVGEDDRVLYGPHRNASEALPIEEFHARQAKTVLNELEDVTENLFKQIEKLRGPQAMWAVFNDDKENPALAWLDNKHDLVGQLSAVLLNAVSMLMWDKEKELAGKRGNNFRREWPKLKPVPISHYLAVYIYEENLGVLKRKFRQMTEKLGRKYTR